MPKRLSERDKREVYVREMVNDRFNLSDQDNDEYFQRAAENEELYHNHIDETENPYLSNIATPWPYIITESYLGKCIQVMAAALPYVRVVEEDDDSRVKARRVEKDANMVLYRQKWPIFSYKVYKQAFKYPSAFILEYPWDSQKDMPVFMLANFFKCKWNPLMMEMEEPDAWFGYEAYLPKWYLKTFEGNPNYKNLDKIKLYEGDTLTTYEQEIRSFKELPNYSRDKYSELVKVWYYWDLQNWIIVTGENNVIRDDGENFLGRIPIRKITPIPLDNEFMGMSILEEGKDLFAERNENRNQFNDAAWLMLNPQYVINRDANIKQRNIESRPGGIIWTDITGGVEPLKQDWNLLAMLIQRQGLIDTDIQNYSNAFPQFRGQPTGGADTATEYLGMKSAGELRSDTYNLLLAMMGVESLVEDIVQSKRMFMTSSNNFFYWPTNRTEKISPDDYEGEFSYKAFASFKHQKELERNHFIQAMGLIFGDKNGAFLPFVQPKTQEWLERLIDYFDIRSPEQLYLSEQEQAMAQIQAVMNQMLTMGAGGGGGSPLALGEKASRTPETTPNSPMGPMIRNEVMQ